MSKKHILWVFKAAKKFMILIIFCVEQLFDQQMYTFLDTFLKFSSHIRPQGSV